PPARPARDGKLRLPAAPPPGRDRAPAPLRPPRADLRRPRLPPGLRDRERGRRGRRVRARALPLRRLGAAHPGAAADPRRHLGLEAGAAALLVAGRALPRHGPGTRGAAGRPERPALARAVDLLLLRARQSGVGRRLPAAADGGHRVDAFAPRPGGRALVSDAG